MQKSSQILTKKCPPWLPPMILLVYSTGHHVYNSEGTLLSRLHRLDAINNYEKYSNIDILVCNSCCKRLFKELTLYNKNRKKIYYTNPKEIELMKKKLYTNI